MFFHMGNEVFQLFALFLKFKAQKVQIFILFLPDKPAVDLAVIEFSVLANIKE